MANYSIQRSDLATGNLTVNEASTNTSTNATLIGQNFTGYGDEIATNFLQMLENFATDIDPTTNGRVVGSAIRGQLWYDTTGTGTLKVYNGATWDAQAKVNAGATESSVLRWNNTAGRYQPEERVRVSDAGSLVIDAATSGANAVTLSHTAGNLLVSTAGTTDITFSGLTGDLTVTGGRGLSVENGVGAFAIRHDGTNSNITHASTTNLVIAGAGLVTAASTTGRAGFNIPTGTAPTSPAQGDMWATATDAFIRINGVSETLLTSGAGVTTLTSLTDVDTSGVITGSLMYKTAGDWTDTPGLTWNGTTLNATQFGGIASANLISRIAPGTLAATIFSSNITSQANLLLGDDDKIIFGTGSDVAVDFDSGTGDFDIAATTAIDLNITGFTGNIISSRPIHATSGGSESIRVIGDATSWSTADSYISFWDSDQNENGLEIGTFAGGTEVLINARLSDLHVYANNTEVARLTSSSTTWTANSLTALVLRNPFTTGANATTSATVGDHNGVQYNVGYNETPTEASVGANINTGSFTLGALSIGKMISRTTSTSRSVTLVNDTDIPVGGSVLVHNGASGGTLTIVPSGITLNWVDGSGSLPASTTRTIAYNSIVTLRKVSSTVWQIWGNGIT